MAELDKDTLATIEGLHDGSLAQSLMSNSKYMLTGMFIGAVGGILIAGLTGKSKMLFAIGTGVMGGSIGYLMAPKEVEVTK